MAAVPGSTLGLSSSGPGALCGFRFFRSLLLLLNGHQGVCCLLFVVVVPLCKQQRLLAPMPLKFGK